MLISVTADIVLFSIKENNVQVLLIKRGGHPFLDHWALPGGFAESDETIFETAKRELYEETSIKDIPIEEIGVFSSPNRDPRSWTMTDSFLAIVDKDKIKPIAGDDAKDAKWFALNEIPTLAFDHDRILRDAVPKLKEKIHFEPIGFELLPDVFTMPQLQALYESILNVKFDRRNFANKILKLGLLEEYGERPKNKGSRIPIKYTLKKENNAKLKSSGCRLEF